MADKVDKPKKQKAKPKRDEKGVLAALPSTRPERIGGRRAAAPKPKPARATAAAKPKTSPKPARAKEPAAPKVAAKPATAARRKPAAARATATRRKAAAPRTFEPTAAAESAADGRSAGVKPPPARDPATSYPRPVREGAPGIGTIGYRDQPSFESGRPNGIELVTTAIQAAGELAQIGFTIGGQILKRAAERLPKP